jgi:hypothetical protein
MSSSHVRIRLAELDTIRFTIGGVTTEMPLDLQLVGQFLREKTVTRQLDQAEEEKLMRFATYLQDARGMASKVGIEFVLPAAAKG